MLAALADSVAEFVHEKFQYSVHTEGEPNEGWILLDIGDIIVHIFSPGQRNYYKLEDLWSQGKILLHLQ
jgi:ribosome-associated protein